jgi:hypothetical protein
VRRQIVAALLQFSMVATIRMVSVYDVMQSLSEMINILLLTVTIIMMCLSGPPPQPRPRAMRPTRARQVSAQRAGRVSFFN